MTLASHITMPDDRCKSGTLHLLGHTLMTNECVALACEIAESEEVSLDVVLPRIGFEMVNLPLFMSEWDITATLERVSFLAKHTFTPSENAKP